MTIIYDDLAVSYDATDVTYDGEVTARTTTAAFRAGGRLGVAGSTARSSGVAVRAAGRLGVSSGRVRLGAAAVHARGQLGALSETARTTAVRLGTSGRLGSQTFAGAAPRGPYAAYGVVVAGRVAWAVVAGPSGVAAACVGPGYAALGAVKIGHLVIPGDVVYDAAEVAYDALDVAYDSGAALPATDPRSATGRVRGPSSTARVRGYVGVGVVRVLEAV